jgi:osmotically-inducible protein OsmY
MSALLSRAATSEETDDTILEQRIRRHLTADSRAVSRLQIEVEAGVVTLRGVANSFYQKQLWLHGTKRVIGEDVLIDDQITVTPTWDNSDFMWRE